MRTEHDAAENYVVLRRPACAPQWHSQGGNCVPPCNLNKFTDAPFVLLAQNI